MCVSKLTIIGLDIGLLPGQHQAIVWTNDETLLIGHLGTRKFKKMCLKMSSGKWQPFCIGLKVLTLSQFESLFMEEEDWFIL